MRRTSTGCDGQAFPISRCLTQHCKVATHRILRLVRIARLESGQQPLMIVEPHASSLGGFCQERYGAGDQRRHTQPKHLDKGHQHRVLRNSINLEVKCHVQRREPVQIAAGYALLDAALHRTQILDLYKCDVSRRKRCGFAL